MKTTAIIVAAGSGSRLDPETPKQFLILDGKPVLAHTLERFQSAPSIDSIVLVLAANRVAEFEQKFDKVIKVVAGGPTRAASVLNGLNAVDSESAIVAVHDGARPFVSVDEIERTVASAKETGAACLVGSVTDTIKTIRGDEISGTLDRDKLRRALTPQVFRSELLRRAFELGGTGEAVTDECYLVEKLGHPIAFVEGSSRNIKITNPEDLALAEAIAGRETGDRRRETGDRRQENQG